MKKIGPSGDSAVVICIFHHRVRLYMHEERAEWESMIIDGLAKYKKLLETGNF